MNIPWGSSVPWVALIVGILFWVGLIAVGLIVLRRALAKGPGAGWGALTEHFGTEEPPVGNPIFHGESVKVGRVVAKRCALVGVSARGLYLKCPWRKAVMIPWTAFSDRRPATLYWGHALQLSVGDPAIASITVRATVGDAIHPYLTAAGEAPRIPPRPRVAPI
ncbi:MAG: hypothetical protein U0794_19010 [Isosphaeraceae bacterium]